MLFGMLKNSWTGLPSVIMEHQGVSFCFLNMILILCTTTLADDTVLPVSGNGTSAHAVMPTDPFGLLADLLNRTGVISTEIHSQSSNQNDSTSPLPVQNLVTSPTPKSLEKTSTVSTSVVSSTTTMKPTTTVSPLLTPCQRNDFYIRDTCEMLDPWIDLSPERGNLTFSTLRDILFPPVTLSHMMENCPPGEWCLKEDDDLVKNLGAIMALCGQENCLNLTANCQTEVSEHLVHSSLYFPFLVLCSGA